MKAIMISIRPEWCEKIANGEKTIEVRKTRPNLPTPLKCYIYCARGEYLWLTQSGNVMTDKAYNRILDDLPVRLNGNVIGEFVCDTFITDRTFGHDAMFNAAACMTEVDAAVYCLNSPMFGWHISGLKIYDTPKALSEFHRPCTPACNYSEECGGTQDGERCLFSMNRPPQSWCYVEEI